MKLILTDDDGTLLDSTQVSPDQWRQAVTRPEVARMLLEELEPGDKALTHEVDHAN